MLTIRLLIHLTLLVVMTISSVVLAKADNSPLLSGADFGVTWQHLGNDLPKPGQASARLTIENRGLAPLAGNWQLYFNACRKALPQKLPAGVRIEHINGDFFRLLPDDRFKPLLGGKKIEFEYDSIGSVNNETDAPQGFYFVFSTEDESRVESVGDYRILPFPEGISRQEQKNLYEQNLSDLDILAEDVCPIMPTPVKLLRGQGTLSISTKTTIYFGIELKDEARLLAESLGVLLGSQLKISPFVGGKEREALGSIKLLVGDVTVNNHNKKRGDCAYQLSVIPKQGIVITGTDQAGVFYGIQSLRAVIPVSAYEASNNDEISLPELTVEDAPRFAYRGMHLDVGRNFQSPATVKKLLDLMAFYKLNKLHFHLTDDEGWRLAIKGLPELTEVGSLRGHATSDRDCLYPSFGSGPDPNNSFGSGHYTREEFIDLLRYATARHIEVIPEIDLPGHSRAAIRSMQVRYDRLLAAGDDVAARKYLLREPSDPSKYESVQMWTDNVIDVCMPSTFEFIEHVFDQIIAIYHEAESPLETIHIGGDEVPHGAWSQSTACAKRFPEQSDGREAEIMTWFVRQCADRLSVRGIGLAGWEEVFLIRTPGKPIEVNQDFVGQPEKRSICYAWNNVWGWGQEDIAYRLANAGVDVVLCNATNLYFDLAQSRSPQEPGYYWAGYSNLRKTFEFLPFDYLKTTRYDRQGNPISPTQVSTKTHLSSEGSHHILGVQGHLWGENLSSQERLDGMTIPRILSLAERAWSEQPEWASSPMRETLWSGLEGDWRQFVSRVGWLELPRLDYMHKGYEYRIPSVGATIKDGQVLANAELPGFLIRYTTNGQEPVATSPLYESPLRLNSNTVRLRAFNHLGRGGITTIVASPVNAKLR